MTDRIAADVLIIGGGLSALRAAAGARSMGADVIVACKGVAGGSGNSFRASGGFAAATGPLDSISRHFEDSLAGGFHLNSASLTQLVVERAPVELERLAGEVGGFETMNGRLYGRPVPAHGRDRSVQFLPGMPALLGKLRRQLESLGVRFIDNHRAIELITSDQGRVCGACLLPKECLHPLVCLSSAVVLATGGCGQLFPVTSNNMDVTGDGYQLGFSAGGTLRDMEFIQFTPTAFAAPDHVRGSTIVSTLLTLDTVRLLNGRKEEFMHRYSAQGKLADRATLARAIHSEVSRGAGTPSGGVYLDLTSVSARELDRHRPAFHQFCIDADIDPAVDYLETAPSAHTCLGGFDVDRHLSVMEGCYAAGECVGGTHGANRLASNSLIEATVTGWIAGCEATGNSAPARISTVQPPQLPSAGNGRSVQLRRKLQDLIGQIGGVCRDGRTLETGFAQLSALEGEFCHAARRGSMNPHQYLDITSLLCCAKLIVRAASIRTESRGAHFRADYPEQNDSLWRRTILLDSDGSGGIRHRFRESA